MKKVLLPLGCRMEGEELSHGRGKVTEKSTLHHGLDSYRSALTLSIRDKQGAFLTVAPAEERKRTAWSRGIKEMINDNNGVGGNISSERLKIGKPRWLSFAEFFWFLNIQTIKNVQRIKVNMVNSLMIPGPYVSSEDQRLATGRGT